MDSVAGDGTKWRKQVRDASLGNPWLNSVISQAGVARTSKPVYVDSNTISFQGNKITSEVIRTPPGVLELLQRLRGNVPNRTNQESTTPEKAENVSQNTINAETQLSSLPNPNTTPIDLMHELLSRDDYISLVEQLNESSDAKKLLDFILQMLRHHNFSNRDPNVNINQRARRFILKIISKIPVIPPSLIVTEVNMPAESEYVGSGGFGRVFKGELRGKVVALKVLCKPDNSVALCREALMWRSLQHKFVLPFLGIYERRGGQFFLVSPYMKNGTLAKWRKAASPSIAEIEERILEVAQGVEYIHSEDIIHGDLRGANILLDDHLHVQIADFGLTRLSEATNTRSGRFHLNFAAPELFGFPEDGEENLDDVPPRTKMSDVYAFGCVYYEIHYGSVPFADVNDIRISILISRGKLPPRQDEPPFSDKTWELIQRCWARVPLERPSMKDVAEYMAAMSRTMSLPALVQNPQSDALQITSTPPLKPRTRARRQKSSTHQSVAPLHRIVQRNITRVPTSAPSSPSIPRRGISLASPNFRRAFD